MIKKIGVENFRVFKEYTEFEIRPITLLTGPNNSGKSSLTKLLLLLQNGTESLNFESGIHNLESFQKVKTWKKNKDFIKVKLSKSFPLLGDNFDTNLTYKNGYISKIELERYGDKLLSIELHGEKKTDSVQAEATVDVFINQDMLVSFILSKKFNVLTVKNDVKQSKKPEYNSFDDITLLNDKYINLIKLKSTEDKRNRTLAEIYDIRNEALNNGLNERIKNKDKNLYIAWINEEGKAPVIDPKELTKAENKIFKDLTFTVINVGNRGLNAHIITDILDKIRIQVIQKLKDFYIKKYPNIEIQENILGKIFFDQKLFNTSRNHRIDFQTTMFEEFRQMIQSSSYHIGLCHYISPQRGNQKRILTNQSDNDIDQIVVEYSKLADPKTEFLEKIFKILEIEGKFQVERHENYISVVSLTKDGQKITLADLGYGYSQIIPIVLKIIIIINQSSERQNFIIEEPEANLHPNLQSKLADVLALSKEHFPNLDFIVETHSEYLIRKLQFLTAKGQLKTNDTAIYYFNADKYVNDKEPKVKKIEITETGNLTDSFGPGFFDEVTQLQFDLMKVNMEQRN